MEWNVKGKGVTYSIFSYNAIHFLQYDAVSLVLSYKSHFAMKLGTVSVLHLVYFFYIRGAFTF